jgi:hypothetical protein
MTDTQISNPVIDLLANIHLSIGKLNKAMDDRNRIQRLASKTQQPVFYTNADSITLSAAGFGIMRLAGPDQGHFWYVRGIAIWSPTSGPGTNTGGVGSVFVTAQDMRQASITSITQISGTDWRDQFTSTQTPHLYSTGQLPLRFNEELYIVMSGVGGPAKVASCCWIEDFEEGANIQAWGM